MLDLTEGTLQGRSVSEFISATLTVGHIPTDARAGEPLDRGLQGNLLREFVVSTLPQGQPLRAVRSVTMPSAQTSFKRSLPSPSIRVVRVIESPTPPPPQTETTLVSPIRMVHEETPFRRDPHITRPTASFLPRRYSKCCRLHSPRYPSVD